MVESNMPRSYCHHSQDIIHIYLTSKFCSLMCPNVLVRTYTEELQYAKSHTISQWINNHPIATAARETECCYIDQRENTGRAFCSISHKIYTILCRCWFNICSRLMGVDYLHLLLSFYGYIRENVTTFVFIHWHSFISFMFMSLAPA